MKMNHLHPLSILLLFAFFAQSCAPKMATVISSETLNMMKPMDILNRLKEGNNRFISGKMIHYDYVQQINNSATQSPPALVLGCMDSRTAPEMVFNQGIGDVFSLRIAGFFATPESIGSMEYACFHAGTKLIVVMGHTHCGAIKSVVPNEKTAKKKHDEDEIPLINLAETLKELKGALNEAQKDPKFKNMTYEEKVAYVVEINVEQTVREIKHDSPALKDKLDKGELMIVGAVYDIDSGKVQFLDKMMLDKMPSIMDKIAH
jgi:carbonic anhydrase